MADTDAISEIEFPREMETYQQNCYRLIKVADMLTPMWISVALTLGGLAVAGAVGVLGLLGVIPLGWGAASLPTFGTVAIAVMLIVVILGCVLYASEMSARDALKASGGKARMFRARHFVQLRRNITAYNKEVQTIKRLRDQKSLPDINLDEIAELMRHERQRIECGIKAHMMAMLVDQYHGSGDEPMFLGAALEEKMQEAFRATMVTNLQQLEEMNLPALHDVLAELLRDRTPTANADLNASSLARALQLKGDGRDGPAEDR